MRRFLFIPLLAMLALAATVAPAMAGHVPASCFINGPTSVPVGGSVTFYGTGLSGQNYLAVFDSPTATVPEYTVPVAPGPKGSSTYTLTSVLLDHGPTTYTISLYSGANGAYSPDRVICSVSATTT